jgi:hypothetical protein
MSEANQPDTRRLSADEALALIQRHQKLKPHEDFRLTVAICNPGGLTAHQTVEVIGIQGGFDWTACQLIVQPAVPLSMLSPEQVADITKSVRAGGSWHAYEREKKSRAELTAAQAKIAQLQTLANSLSDECEKWAAMHQQSKAKIASLEAERDDWRNRATEAQAERDAAREERDAALVRVSAMEGEVTVPDDMQEWARLDGAVAWHLIERHADSWADVGKMMDEFIAARIDAARKNDAAIDSASSAAREAT